MVPPAPASRPPPSCWPSASGTRCSTPAQSTGLWRCWRAAKGSTGPTGRAWPRLAFGLEISFAFVGEGLGGTNHVFLRGSDISKEIRVPEISDGASRVSALPEVRAALLDLQRRLAAAGGVVVEGRDIGTVVFPHAAAKFFLTATAEERAHRRVIELRAAGRTVDPAETLARAARARPPGQHAGRRAAAQGRRRRRDRLERHGPGRGGRSDGRGGAIAWGMTGPDAARRAAQKPLLGPPGGRPRRSLTFPNVDASFRAFAAPNGRSARKITPTLNWAPRAALARSEQRTTEWFQ